MALDLHALDAAAAAMSDAPLTKVPVRVAPTAPPSAFMEDPAQPRSEFVEDDRYAALVASVRLRGILQPLIVRRLPAGLLQIRFGARRFRAAIAAGMAQIPYLEVSDERQFDDYAQVEENQARLDLQPLDLAQFIERKLAAGEKKKDIAARLHIDPSAITHLLALAYGPPALLLELYHSQRCRAPHLLYALRKLLKQHGPALEQALTDSQEIDRQRVEALTATLAQCSGGAAAEATKTAQAELVGDSDKNDVPRRPVAESGRAGIGRRGAALRDAAPVGTIEMPTVCVDARLLGHHHGAALELLLYRAPQGEGWIWCRYLDGDRTVQIRMAEIVLTSLHIESGPRPAAGALARTASGLAGQVVGAGGDTAAPATSEPSSA